jgi:Flp pilus assembly protein TadG
VTRQRQQQRGSVSVELALGLPILVMVVVASVHFGLVVKTRHELGDATSHATRLAAIARNADAGMIRNAIQSRLGASSSCSNIVVSSATAIDAFGVRRVDVTARCTVNTGVAGPLIAFLGPAEIAARSSMPF